MRRFSFFFVLIYIVGDGCEMISEERGIQPRALQEYALKQSRNFKFSYFTKIFEKMKFLEIETFFEFKDYILLSKE